jgi:hypothetical protein
VDGTLSIKPDTYNFDMKNPFKDSDDSFQRVMDRNFKTIIGLGINGFGNKYDIQFTGSIPAPKGLPK